MKNIGIENDNTGSITIQVCSDPKYKLRGYFTNDMPAVVQLKIDLERQNWEVEIVDSCKNHKKPIGTRIYSQSGILQNDLDLPNLASLSEFFEYMQLLQIKLGIKWPWETVYIEENNVQTCEKLKNWINFNRK